MITSLDDLRTAGGGDLGVSGWHRVGQAEVDAFADATGDHQWIHVDPDRAARGPFGGTIAHGYLTLALTASLLTEVVAVRDQGMGVNYGCNRVRFPTPVRVGARVRLRVRLLTLDDLAGGAVQVTYALTVELEGAAKPACVAETVARYYPAPTAPAVPTAPTGPEAPGAPGGRRAT